MQTRVTRIFPGSLPAALECLLPAAALFYFLAYLYIALSRITYPFELEWMEGGSLVEVNRLLAGQSLYVRPSLDFVPFVYAPLYFYLSALVSQLSGPGFLPLRLVSFAASLSCFTLIFLLVKRQASSARSALLGAGLFAAMFYACGAWFDVARVDSLFVALLLLGFFLISLESRPSYTLAGVAFSLAFLTKQTALVSVLPVLLYAVFANPKRSGFLLGAIVIVLGSSIAYLNRVSDGWYNYYVFILPGRHGYSMTVASRAVWDVLAPQSIAWLFAVAGLVLPAAATFTGRHRVFYAMLLAGMVSTSLLGRLSLGGFRNNLMPGYAAISILFGIGVSRVLALAASLADRQRAFVRIAVSIVCAVQFAVLAYPIRSQIPTAEDLKAGTDLVERIRQVQGDVFVPSHNYLPILAGKRAFAHYAALQELRGKFGPGDKEMWNEVHAQISLAMQGRFTAVVLDDEWLSDELGARYVRQSPLFASRSVFWPRTGRMTRPEAMYLLANGGAK